MANYPIPPWLSHQGADPAAAFVSAFSAGANVSEARARMAQHAEEVGLRLAQAEREQQRQAQLDYQKLEISRAYNDAMLGLREQQLINQQEENTRQAIDAANKFALDYEQGREVARHNLSMEQQGAGRLQLSANKYANQLAGIREYQTDITPVEQGGRGMKPMDSMLRLAPTIAGGMSGVGSVLRAAQGGGVAPMDFANTPAFQIKDASGRPIGKFGWQTGPRSATTIDAPRQMGTNAPVAIRVYDSEGNPTSKQYIPGAAAGGGDYFFTDEEEPPDEVVEAQQVLKDNAGKSREDMGPLRKKAVEDAEKIVREWKASRAKKRAPSAGQAGTNTVTRFKYNPATGELEPK